MNAYSISRIPYPVSHIPYLVSHISYLLVLILGWSAITLAESPLSVDDFTDETDIITEALKTKGLTRETARLDAQTLDWLLAQEPMAQTHFSRYWKNPWDFPKFVYSLTDFQIKNSDKPDGIYQLFVIATIRSMGHRVTAYMEYAPKFEPQTDSPLLEALEGMYKRCGIAAVTDTLKSAIGGVPKEMQLPIAKFIYAAGEAKFYRDRALRHYPKDKWHHTFDYACRNFSINDEEPEEEFADGTVINWDMGKLVDFDDLYTGTVPSLLAIMDMEAFLNNPVYLSAVTDTAQAGTPTITTDKPITPTEAVKIDLSKISFEF
ncbi:MAG: hypothetical protein HY762_03050, partial [Planctomycetes bacterium]|nr:hypothetical protein [Planctomycetota bacterium]